MAEKKQNKTNIKKESEYEFFLKNHLKQIHVIVILPKEKSLCKSGVLRSMLY